MNLSHKWLPICYAAYISSQIADILTTVIGFGIGHYYVGDEIINLVEGNAAMNFVLQNFGLQGMITLKIGFTVGIGLCCVGGYYFGKRYKPESLDYWMTIFAAVCLAAALTSLLPVVSNTNIILRAM